MHGLQGTQSPLRFARQKLQQLQRDLHGLPARDVPQGQHAVRRERGAFAFGHEANQPVDVDLRVATQTDRQPVIPVGDRLNADALGDPFQFGPLDQRVDGLGRRTEAVASSIAGASVASASRR